jgi:thioredoxin 1
MSGIETLTDALFEARVLRADGAVVLAFTAPWSPPCRALEPVIEEVAREVEGRARVLEMDLGSESQIAAHYQVMVVPTVMVFLRGRLVARETGMMSKERLLDLVALACSESGAGAAN